MCSCPESIRTRTSISLAAANEAISLEISIAVLFPDPNADGGCSAKIGVAQLVNRSVHVTVAKGVWVKILFVTNSTSHSTKKGMATAIAAHFAVSMPVSFMHARIASS